MHHSLTKNFSIFYRYIIAHLFDFFVNVRNLVFCPPFLRCFYLFSVCLAKMCFSWYISNYRIKSKSKTSPPACGRDRVGSQHRYEILPPKPNQERNIIKWKRIRRGGFFPLRSAKRNISHHVVIYRIRRIYHAGGISCALRARGEGAKTSRKREVLLLPNSRRGVVCLKHREYFDLCGGRLKALP